MRKRNPTIRDIAKQANVSPSLVSRVLNYDSALKIPESTKERVFKAAEELGYQLPEEKKSKMKRVGIVTAHDSKEELDNNYLVTVRVLLERYTLMFGMDSILISMEESALISKVDGLICFGGFTESQLKRIETFDKPTVFVDTSFDSSKYFSVSRNLKSAMNQAIDFLLELNITNIAYIGGRTKGLEYDDRESEFLRLMADLNGTNTPMIMKANNSAEKAYQFSISLLSKNERPSAIIVGNDTIALGVYKAAHELNIKIPEALSIISLENSEKADYFVPSLTSVDTRLDYMCNLAVEILEQQLEGKVRIPVDIYISTQLILRESTKKKIQNKL
ncbi:MAG TPA: LacI family DNA-binding transcriptional regulator [Erysipelothrix sp.]